jgi:hypothetical protein
MLFTATAASFVATLTGTLWRESRTGCVVHGQVFCTTSMVDVGARWPGIIAGALLALLVVVTTGRLRRVAQAVVMMTMTAGTAVFTADQHRWAMIRPAVCYPGADGECAFPAWHLRDLVVGALVGVALGLLTLAGEQASSRARATGSLGVRRTLASLLIVGSVPAVLLGLFALVENDAAAGPGPRLLLGSGLAVFALGQSLRSRQPEPATTAGP